MGTPISPVGIPISPVGIPISPVSPIGIPIQSNYSLTIRPRGLKSIFQVLDLITDREPLSKGCL